MFLSVMIPSVAFLPPLLTENSNKFLMKSITIDNQLMYLGISTVLSLEQLHSWRVNISAA